MEPFFELYNIDIVDNSLWVIPEWCLNLTWALLTSRESYVYIDYAWIKDNDIRSGNLSPVHLCKKMWYSLYFNRSYTFTDTLITLILPFARAWNKILSDGSTEYRPEGTGSMWWRWWCWCWWWWWWWWCWWWWWSWRWWRWWWSWW